MAARESGVPLKDLVLPLGFGILGGVAIGVGIQGIISYLVDRRRSDEIADLRRQIEDNRIKEDNRLALQAANTASLPFSPSIHDFLVPSTEAKIFRVVLTGGPCGGKTTAMNILTRWFREAGWRVYAVPEVATLLWSGGVAREELRSAESVYQFQTNLLKVMQSLEEAYLAMARVSGVKSIVFCDRGTMDSSAYMDPLLWQALLDENHWTTVGLRDERYDCVVHLVTAAIGKPECYNTDTNVTRSETAEEAAAIDVKLARAWIGHPYLVLLDNTVDFEAKMKRVIGVVSNRAEGRIEPLYSKRKFLVKIPVVETFPAAHQDFDVEYTYLIGHNGEGARLSKRGQYGSYIYTYQNVGAEATKRSVTGREYVNLLLMKDRSRQTIRQRQRYFIYKEQCWHLCWYISPHKGLCLLQVYTRNDVVDVDLPPFLDIEKEVTRMPEYNMYVLAGRPGKEEADPAYE